MSHKKSVIQIADRQDEENEGNTFRVVCFEDENGLVNLDLGATLLRFTKEEFVLLADAMSEVRQCLTDEIGVEDASLYAPNILLM